MLENMMGSTGKYYPWSGPGNKKLKAGDRDLGYFGEVSQNELFSDKFLVTLADQPVANTNVAVGNVWLKFILDDRILFTPKYPFMVGSISWNKLYAAGAVYGVRGPGPLPVPDAGEIDQFKFLTKIESVGGTKKVWPLKLQLFNAAQDFINTTADWESERSDWDRFWTTFFDKKWENYTWASIQGTAKYSITRERTADGAYAGYRGPSLEKGHTPVNNAGGTMTWRPVIELITDPNTALEVYQPSFSPIGGLRDASPVFSLDDTVPVKGVVNVIAVNSELQSMLSVLTTGVTEVYFEPMGGGILLEAGFQTVPEVMGIADVSGRNSALKTPSLATTTVREELYGTAPSAGVTLVATIGQENVGLTTPVKPRFSPTAQLEPRVIMVSVEGVLLYTNDTKQNLLPPTFTIEDDGT